VSVDYPPHDPRAGDPHYALFNTYRAAHLGSAACWYAVQIGDTSRCRGGYELHHGVVEYAAINAVDPRLLDQQYPDAGASLAEIEAWVESSPESLIWLCEKHHRGAGTGAHTVMYAIWKTSLVAPSILPESGPPVASGGA
jgi:hypothetical protein